METYKWTTTEPLSNNTDNMNDFVDNHMQGYFGEILTIVHDEGTYIEVQSSNHILYGIHASGDGDFCNHKVEIEELK